MGAQFLGREHVMQMMNMSCQMANEPATNVRKWQNVVSIDMKGLTYRRPLMYKGMCVTHVCDVHFKK